MTVHHDRQARIWSAYCEWQVTGRDRAKLVEIAQAHDVTPYDIEDCHHDHTAD